MQHTAVYDATAWKAEFSVLEVVSSLILCCGENALC